MKRKSSRFYSSFIYFIVLNVVFSLFAPIVNAEENQQISTTEQQNATDTSQNQSNMEEELFPQASNLEPSKNGEEVEYLRTETAKVYANPDDTYSAEVFSEPIHYKRNGKWEDIDNTLTENSQQEYENKANQFKVKFPKKPKVNQHAKLYDYEIKGHSIEVEFVDQSTSKPKVYNGTQDIATVKGKGKIQYKGLYPGVNFDYVLDGTKLKENIILDSYQGKNQFDFHIKSQGIKAEKKESGIIEFTDEKTGEFLFYIQRPYMYDSAEGNPISNQITQDISTVSDGFLLSLKADESYLTDPSRNWPIVIDPWIDVFQAADTFVASGTTSNYNNLSYLSVGYNASFGKTRSYMKWTLPTIPNAKVTGASVGVFQNTAVATPDIPVSLHKVTGAFNASTMTWSTQPSFDPTPETTKSNLVQSYNYFGVSDLVKGWYDGSIANNGVVLKYTDTQEGTALSKQFKSSEYANPDGTSYGKPKLVISYRSNKLLGITDYWEYTPDLFKGEGNAVVNVINGNMVYDIPVLSLPGRTNAFNLNFVYNSRSNFEDVYGYRWTFSGQRKLIPNSTKTIVEYIDDHGTHYHFNKQQDDTGTLYSSPEGTFFTFNSTTDGGYTLKESDETMYYFDSLGRNTKVVDENENTILYTFDGTSNRIIKISERYGTETTGRDINLAYNSTTGLLDKITDFRGTETKFTYSHLDVHNRLETITYAANRPEAKKITFGYIGQQLTSVTDAKGNKGEFGYDSFDRVNKITDPRSTDYFAELQYPSVNETIFIDANKHKTYYKSNIDKDLATVNVIEKTEDYQGVNPSTTQYEWKNNEVTKVIEPNKDNGTATGATTSADYDDKGNMLNQTSPDQSTEVNHYDSKSNQIDQSINGVKTSDNTYDSESNVLFSSDQTGTTNYQTYDRYGNNLSSATPSSIVYNYIPNRSFETVDANNLPVNWGMRSGSAYSIVTTSKFGNRSAKISLTSTDSYKYYFQNIPISTTLADKTFTVSGYVKTDNVTGTGAQVFVYFKDTNDQFIRDTSGNTISYSTNPLKGTRDWTNVSYTFTAPSNTAYIQVLLNFNGVGSAYFDGIQLHQGNMVQDFVSNENEGMESGSGTTLSNWTLNALGTGDGRSSEQVKTGQYSAKLTGISTASRYIGQLVPAKGKSGDPITISGWAYAKNPNFTGDFSLQISFVYTDGTEGKFTVPFDKTLTDEWQFVKKAFRAVKDFSQIKLYGNYNSQTGTVYFDNIKAEERGATSSTTYTGDGNFSQTQTNVFNQVTSFEYDANGNQTVFTTSSGNRTTFGYDYLNQLTSVTQVAPARKTSITVGYQYDAEGNLEYRTDPRGNVTSYEYNPINQLTKETDPLGKYNHYDYDLNGNLSLSEKGKGTNVQSKTELKYDNKNQLQEKWLNGQKIASYGYDFAGNVTSIQYKGDSYGYGYDAINRLKFFQEPSGYKVESNYIDKANDISNGLRNSIVETFGGNSYTTTIGYDSLQRLSSLKTSTGSSTEFYYNEKSRPTQIRFYKNGTSLPFSLYQSFDELGRYASQQLVGPSDLDLKYGYDQEGNLNSYFDGSDTQTFTYDFANRLETWTYKGNTVTYDYDTAGNLKNPSSTNLTFNAANEVEGFTYDDAGNLVQDDKYRYEWDDEGRLVAIKNLSGNTISSYTYFPDGLRKTKTVGTSTFSYHYDGSDLIRITDQNNQTIWVFTWANGKPNTVTNSQGQTFYYITNYRGDVVKIVDDAGSIVADYSYDPWGNIIQTNENSNVANQPIGYAGYNYDRETKLYYLQDRYYDPVIGKFVSRDPYSGKLDNSASQNSYSYADNNPITNIDSDGKSSEEIWFKFGLAIIDAIHAHDGTVAIMSKGAKKDIKKKFGKRGLKAFENAMSKGIVAAKGKSGIKRLSGNGIHRGGKFYRVEIKIVGGEYGDYRVFGNWNSELRCYYFTKFGKGEH